MSIKEEISKLNADEMNLIIRKCVKYIPSGQEVAYMKIMRRPLIIKDAVWMSMVNICQVQISS